MCSPERTGVPPRGGIVAEAYLQELRIRRLMDTYRKINAELQTVPRTSALFKRLAKQHIEVVVELDELLREDALI